ncbi:MAG: hypothetical protein NVS2B16_07020 [Chloroflexota bacterium]
MGDVTGQGLWEAYLEGKINRGQLFKATAIAMGIAVLPGSALADTRSTGGAIGTTSFPFFPQVSGGTYTPESIAEIVGNMLTHDYLHLNAGMAVIGTPALAAKLGITAGLPSTYFQAFVAIHQYQIDFWSALVPGATPITSFTLDPKIVADAPTFLAAGEAVDSLRVATQIAAAREFAELGQPTLVKYAVQDAGVQAEMRVSIRYLGALGGNPGSVPPNNKAFETDLLLYTRDGVNILRGLGIIGGNGIPLAYAGRDAVLSAAGSVGKQIVQKSPNDATSTVALTGLGSLISERT